VNDLGYRIRATVRAAASTVLPDSVPPLRLPQMPLTRTRRRAAPPPRQSGWRCRRCSPAGRLRWWPGAARNRW